MALTRFTWDDRESKEILSTGIIRIYLFIENFTGDSSYSASTIGVKNLKFTYADGSEKIVDFYFSNVIVQNEQKISDKFELSQNYPNPFNQATNIKFSVPQTQYVSLKVYDVLGNEVTTLVDEEKFASNYIVQFNGNSLASGVYLYRLQAGSFVQTKKLMLMK